MSRSLLLALAPIALGACTMVGGGVQPAAGPGPAGLPEVDREVMEPGATREAEDRDELPPNRIAARVVELALENLGTPYEWGGTDANGFDCSGLIQFSYARFGIRLPRVSAAQLRAGSRIDPTPARLRPGDILGFSARPGGKTSHVGLYVGRGEFIHSSSGGVRISTLDSAYWQEHLVAARRIVE